MPQTIDADRIVKLEEKIDALTMIVSAQVQYLESIQGEIAPLVEGLMANPMVKMMMGGKNV